MIVAFHAMAHFAINCVPINWNLPISFGMFRRAERAAEQATYRPVTAQDLECSPNKVHRRRGNNYPDKAVGHAQVYYNQESLKKSQCLGLHSALAEEFAKPAPPKPEAAIYRSLVNLCAPKNQNDDVPVYYEDDFLSSGDSTPALSPWASLEPEESPEVSPPDDLALANQDHYPTEDCRDSASRINRLCARSFSINRKQNGQIDLIGKGTFGSVYKGKYHGQEVAIKLTGLPTFRRQSEGQVFARIGHHNYIIRLHTFYREGFGADKIETLVLEYASADLGTFMRTIHSQEDGSLSPYHTAFIADCLSCALAHVHKKGYAHLDVSPANVLILGVVPKLADFSSSLKWKVGDRRLNVYPVGTIGFRAPEVIERRGYDNGADWFSLGVLVYYMLKARLPWVGIEDAQMAFLREDKSRLFEDLPKPFVPVVRDLLADKPDARVTKTVASFLDDYTYLRYLNSQ